MCRTAKSRRTISASACATLPGSSTRKVPRRWSWPATLRPWRQWPTCASCTRIGLWWAWSLRSSRPLQRRALAWSGCWPPPALCRAPSSLPCSIVSPTMSGHHPAVSWPGGAHRGGDLDSPQLRQLLHGYVRPLLDAGCDTLILGCTHYPFLRPLLASMVPADVAIIDTGAAVARQLQRLLAARDLLAEGQRVTPRSGPAPNHSR